MTETFYWHDYETWGADPSRDRASQFAGLRTDLDLNPIGKPLVIYAKPADDFLPHPEACMVTGISPQLAFEQGAPEVDFFRFIHEELSTPGTCALGYNTLRFDDTVTRFGLYRNFYDPYEREYANGNSRWDLIDVVRLTRALRPEGINWPTKDDGSNSFRLEDLTAANNIEHAGAHDALVDVKATIALAKLLKQAQPKLFDYVFTHRDKHSINTLLDVVNPKPVVHSSMRFPARLGCIASVLPLIRHPKNPNQVITYDLRVDPTPLLECDVDELKARLYTSTEDLPEGIERIALKGIRVNQAPVVVPINTLTDEAREQWDLGLAREQKHIKLLLNSKAVWQKKLEALYASDDFAGDTDPDFNLYGGFIGAGDKRLAKQLHLTPPEELASSTFPFEDERWRELVWRYRARNWPDHLSTHEKTQWDEFRRQRIQEGGATGPSLKDYRKTLSKMVIDPALSEQQRQLVDQLLEWPTQIGID